MVGTRGRLPGGAAPTTWTIARLGLFFCVFSHRGVSIAAPFVRASGCHLNLVLVHPLVILLVNHPFIDLVNTYGHIWTHICIIFLLCVRSRTSTGKRHEDAWNAAPSGAMPAGKRKPSSKGSLGFYSMLAKTAVAVGKQCSW